MTCSLLWLPSFLPSQVCQGAQQLKSSNGSPFQSFQNDYINGYICVCVGALAKLRKETLASSCLSACPSVHMEQLGFHWTDFHETWYLTNFSKICRENSSVIKIWQKWRVLYMKTSVHFWSYFAHFFLEWEMFQTKDVEKIKTHILCSVTFFLNRTVYEIMWRDIVERGGHRWQYSACALHAV